MKSIVIAALITACGSSVVERPTYDVTPRGWIDLGRSPSILQAARCFEKADDFRAARWLEDRARSVHQIYLGATPIDADGMAIQLDAGPPLAASRVVRNGEAWWGFWDDGASTFVVALRCKKDCDVTMSVVRRTDGTDRFASSCVERWVGSAKKHKQGAQE